MCANPFKVIKNIFSPPEPKIVVPPAPPPPPPPAPPPPPPAPSASAPVSGDGTMDDLGQDGDGARKRKGRSALRIDLAAGNATSGGTGLNIPRG